MASGVQEEVELGAWEDLPTWMYQLVFGNPWQEEAKQEQKAKKEEAIIENHIKQKQKKETLRLH